jgi:hypothetical protein
MKVSGDCWQLLDLPAPECGAATRSRTSRGLQIRLFLRYDEEASSALPELLCFKYNTQKAQSPNV